MPPYGQGPALEFPENIVVEQLSSGLTQPPVIAFVISRIDTSKLYAEFINQDPSFFVLSNPSNATDVQFTSGRSGGGGWYQGGQQPPSPASTLRGVLGMDDASVSILLIDGDGILRKAATVNRGELANKIAEINRAMQRP